MRKSFRIVGSIAILVVLAFFLGGCASYPSQVVLDPARYENDAIRVEWAIGINFFRIKLTNLTELQIDLDLVNSAVVSVDGEARQLSALAGKDAAMVPPHAYVIISSDRGAVFGTDILGRFNAETEERYPLPLNVSGDDRVFLKGHTGDLVRLYLTANVRGKSTLYDIQYKITGTTRVQRPGEKPEPVLPAPASAPPSIPGGPKGKP